MIVPKTKSSGAPDKEVHVPSLATTPPTRVVVPPKNLLKSTLQAEKDSPSGVMTLTFQ
jgi:hypothetical protein